MKVISLNRCFTFYISKLFLSQSFAAPICFGFIEVYLNRNHCAKLVRYPPQQSRSRPCLDVILNKKAARTYTLQCIQLRSGLLLVNRFYHFFIGAIIKFMPNYSLTPQHRYDFPCSSTLKAMLTQRSFPNAFRQKRLKQNQARLKVQAPPV